jgi:cation diffusion facilitator CzcD-associated flavoprotein CzcO
MAYQAVKNVLLFGLTLASALPTTELRDTSASQSTEYEYIVVGSGAGGGPLASRLASEGHSVLLIEAGDDQSNNPNTTVPIFQTLVSGDPQLRWDVSNPTNLHINLRSEANPLSSSSSTITKIRSGPKKTPNTSTTPQTAGILA